MDFLDDNEHPPELINKDKFKDMHFSENLRTTSTDMMVEAVANQSKLIPEGKRWHFQKNVEYEEPHLNQHLYDMSSESEHQNAHDSTKLEDFIDEEPQQHIQSQQPLPQIQQPAAPELSQEEMMLRKLDMLRKLGELAQNGIKLSQNYNMNSDYQTMKFEYDLHYSIRSKKNSINWMTNMMMNCVYGIEMMNDRYNPFDFKLKGWSEQMNSDIGNYYDVFGELYEKYNKPGKNVAPEMKLLFMISGSAIKFHLSNKLLGSLPNLTSMLSSNSNLTQQLRNLTVQEKIKEQNTKTNQIIENKVNFEHDKAKQMAEDINFLKQKELEYLKREQEQLKSNSILEQLIKQQQEQQKPSPNQVHMKMPSRIVSPKVNISQETDQEISDRLQHKFGIDQSEKSDVKTEVHRNLSKISELASSILNKNTFNDQSETMLSSDSNSSPVTDKNVIDYEDLKSSLSFGTKKGKKRVFNVKSK
jgi:hypothetical protein